MPRKEELIRSLLQDLWRDSSTKDFELICARDDVGRSSRGKSLWCHRPILALASPFLKNLIRDSESYLVLPDFTSEVVEKLLRLVYVTNVDNDDLTDDVTQLASHLGIKTTFFDGWNVPEVAELSVDINPLHIKGETLENRLEQLKNVGLSIYKSRDAGDRSVGSNGDNCRDDVEFLEPAINFAIRSTRRLKKLGRLLKGSGGQIVVLKAPASIVSKKRRRDEMDDTNDNDGSVDNAASDADDDQKSQQTCLNLSSIVNKDQVPIKVKCWDCSNIVSTTMKEYEDVIGRIQSSIPNFTANFRCQDCISREGLPTEENIRAKKKVRVKKRQQEKRDRQKAYEAKTMAKESLWKDDKKMEELKQQKLLCQFCGKQFSVVQGHLYWDHMNMHQNVTPYRCHIEGCSFGTHSKPEFSLHMKKVHPPVGDEGIFQCDKCPLQSISQKNLAEHIRKFHDETSEKNVYECDQCFYRSASVQGLSQHKTRWHKSDSQKFTCQICNAKLGNRKSIYEHMRKIHNVLRACKFCDFKHQDCDMVRRHTQEVHRDQMPYACNLCLYCTNRQKFLQRHIETMHSEPSRKKEFQHLQQPDYDGEEEDY